MNKFLWRIADHVHLQAISGSTSSKEMNDSELKEEKSDIYSSNMTEAMGAGKFTHTL